MRISIGGLVGLAAIGLVWLAAPRLFKKGGTGPSAAVPVSASDMTRAPNAGHAKPNRLAREKSPYLLQHAMNPVDWYPWGEEAFDRARREDKPIFLSIGYSTCHWCHVMERESFENDSVAALLNRDFVPIKVDREERPDVDRIYMTAVQAMGMGGGWPLNVFLTPDLKPFFGGTYFPPDSRHGRAGLIEILPRVHEAWVGQRDRIEATGAEVFRALAAGGAHDSVTLDRERLIESAYQTLAASFDAARGGFGVAPKFPSIGNLNFLMRYWIRDPARRGHAREMVIGQLEGMRAGGIHDHLGGGFHRYATDADWLVPHFEKMLYDQAQIAWAYLEAYQATGRPEDAETARGVLDYVARDLTSPDGAFLSAEDADSEGEEGKFYVWTPGETRAALGERDAAVFDYRYGVTAAGNFEHGASILHEAHTLAETALRFKLLPDEARELLAGARARLLAARSQRIRPHRDDKVLTAWNGLMISAMARGARVLGDPRLRERAERAAEFVWRHLYDEKSGALERRWRDGEAAGAGQLDDYAYLALGLIDLYGASFDPQWLERAARLTEAQIARFWDQQDGAFFESPAGDPHVALRLKDDYDGAELAGNSVAALDLEILATLLDRGEWREKARLTLDVYARRLARNPAAMAQMLVAMDLADALRRQVVIAGPLEAADTRALVAEFNHRFLPHDALLVVDGGAAQRRLAALLPFTASLTARDRRATAYVCIDYACRLPTTDRAAFAAQLDEHLPREHSTR